MEDVKKLLKEALENPSKMDELSEEEITKALSKVNPYDKVIPSDKSWINISIINMRDDYLRKLHTTALIGYMYQLAEEFNPAETDLSFEEYDNMKDSEIDEYNKKNGPQQRAIITNFLNRHFHYNPNFHIGSSHTSNEQDPERILKEKVLDRIKSQTVTKKVNQKHNKELAKELYQNTEGLLTHLKKTQNVTDNIMENFIQLATYVNEVAGDFKNLCTEKLIISKYEDLQNKCSNFIDVASDVSSLNDILLKKILALNGLLDKLGSLKQICELDIKAVYEKDPPKNLFYHFDRYLTNNYEQLREAVKNVYNEKPDMEFAIQYYDCFDSQEKAKDYRKRYESKFTCGVNEIENNQWTLLGPFKENRDRVDFYNKNTEILKMMFSQMEKDHEIGRQLLKDQVSKKKKKNIREVGPDDKGLEAYKSALSNIEALGAKEMLSREDKEKMAEEVKAAERAKEMLEVPDDAIQVDVFKTDEKGEFTKEIFYTKAEAPNFMEEQIEDQKAQLMGLKGKGKHTTTDSN